MRITRLASAISALLFFAGTSASQQPTVGIQLIQTQALSSAADYWTPERRASAIPRDMRVAGAIAPVSNPQFPAEGIRTAPGALPEPGLSGIATGDLASPWTAEQAGAAVPGVDSLGAQLDAFEALAAGQYPYPFSRYNVPSTLYRASTRVFPYTAVGKLFFTLFGVNYVCSASVIRPHLLLTARHCIYDYASKKWATNVVFYPGYYQGPNSALGGAWYARALITHVSGAAGWDYDIGFIQTFNKNRTGCKATTTNKQVESYTGYLSYKYGGTYNSRQFEDLGFPQGLPFTGKVMVQCSAKTGLVNARGLANTIEIGCDQTGGCSGGPWLNNFAPGVAGSKNQATSVNSFRWSDRPLAINGPQFLTGNFYNLLTKAISLSCP
ncbi:MAG: hypothetical protein KIT09_01095 [Bryobacteraceae bacterium]|nr:hypothetical protein [Bryobacteraceae bacterium]